MKNLESMGVQEMDARALVSENGGFAPLSPEWLIELYCGFLAGYEANKLKKK
jgi:hypothetical protein